MPASELEQKLQKLHELVLELSVRIGGCGCCGSPWISLIEGGEAVEHIDDVRIGHDD